MHGSVPAREDPGLSRFSPRLRSRNLV